VEPGTIETPVPILQRLVLKLISTTIGIFFFCEIVGICLDTQKLRFTHYMSSSYTMKLPVRRMSREEDPTKAPKVPFTGLQAWLAVSQIDRSLSLR